MPGQYLTAVFELHPTRAKGRSRTKARRQHMGHPPKLTPQQQTEARRREGGEPIRDIARSYAVHHGTISRLTV
jgi:hypothetical protein